MADLYLALLHHPVLDKNGQVVTTAVTNMDIHDIARSARTYGIPRFYVVTFCSLPVALSRAATLRMPLASMSKVTSTCGVPRGAGGMPSRRKRPRLILSVAIGRSPCST